MHVITLIKIKKKKKRKSFRSLSDQLKQIKNISIYYQHFNKYQHITYRLVSLTHTVIHLYTYFKHLFFTENRKKKILSLLNVIYFKAM